MNDASERVSPNLHAIFGIDGEPVGDAALGDPTLEMRAAEVPPAEQDVDQGAFDMDTPTAEHAPAERLPAAPAGDLPAELAEQPAPDGADSEWKGITRPSRRGSSSRFLTDVIVDMGLCSRVQVDEAIGGSRNTGTTPERVLLDSGALTRDGLARALAERYGLDHLDLGVFSVDPSAANLVSAAAAKRYQAVPVAFAENHTLLVAMADPANVLAVDDIAIMTGYEVRVAVAPPDDIATLIGRLDKFEDVVADSDRELREIQEEEGTAEVVDLHETADDAPVVKLVNQIVAQAVERGASDIHLAPDGHEVRVRFRVDGVLQDITTIPRRMAPGVISRVKIMAELDIAERRLPQDGRVGLSIDGRHIDLRVVTLPSVHGESIVLRVLDKSSAVVELDKLGMAPPEHERFERAFHEAHGAVLVTGPTGSGKSTTLYAALAKLNTPEKNIITVEDPVEYEIDGLTQVQISTKVGLTFAAGLRAMVRADPDIIMIGEIRDRETAQIAVESALTGHLVLSTLHTNDAPSAITRLTEMGLEPFLVASALHCVVAQRLARRLCPDCKKRTIIPAHVLHESGYKAVVDLEAYEPNGCRRCGGSGYRGRVGLYEVMSVTPEVQQLALERRPSEEIRDVAVRQGMRRLRDDGLEKVREGRTSITEIARVIGSG
ncbi:MAG TPA: ATPase, T2SS/T4P/T4SS family [Solirubrobacteraceae bacterium]|nr:ATPase, T2SS/T4P/T4SS family [Solirubrobacteraceae bacterium]